MSWAPVAVTAAYNWALHSALQAHGIEIPFPQRDLNVKTLFGLSGDDARSALGLTESATQADTDTRTPQPKAEADDNDAIDDVNADTNPDTVAETRLAAEG